MGCAAAYYAARAGLSVLLFERDTPGSAQSGRNLGFVRQQGRDFRELPLAMGAARIWDGLEADLGRSLGWTRNGYIALATSEDEMARQTDWCDESHHYGLDTQILGIGDLHTHGENGFFDLAPQCGPSAVSLIGGLIVPFGGIIWHAKAQQLGDLLRQGRSAVTGQRAAPFA